MKADVVVKVLTGLGMLLGIGGSIVSNIAGGKAMKAEVAKEVAKAISKK